MRGKEEPGMKLRFASEGAVETSGEAAAGMGTDLVHDTSGYG